MATATAQIRIGCSGWSYRDWRTRFYPTTLPTTEWLAYYAGVFDTVELNNSFYRLPPATAVAQWRKQAPPGFIFAVKASRFLTHMKKLKDAEEPLAQFLGRMHGLGRHQGPLLYQLPPHWRCNPERLETFLALLPKQLAHVFEFREKSWLCDAVFRLLERYGASLCVHDMTGIAVPKIAVGRIAYVRFHGTDARYAGTYADAALRGWAAWILARRREGRPVFAYFNNDVGAQAVADAQRLRGFVAG